jgi:hypothetical protein
VERLGQHLCLRRLAVGRSATAAKPVMNITLVRGLISAQRWASSMPSISGMTMSDSSRSNSPSSSSGRAVGAAIDGIDFVSCVLECARKVCAHRLVVLGQQDTDCHGVSLALLTAP